MSRVCSRPGCAEPATATFAYAPAQLRAWVGDLTEERRAVGHDLCGVHADRLTVPSGWELTDARTERASLSAVEPASPMLARAFRAAKAS